MERRSHQHVIPTSPDVVWSTLVDLGRWPAWNTLTAAAPAGLVVGAPFELVLKVGGRSLPITATLVEVEPAVSLVWRGGPRGLFHALHGFRLTRRDDGGTDVLHFETFEGLLVRPILALLGPDHPGMYERVNRRLEAACAAGQGGTTG